MGVVTEPPGHLTVRKWVIITRLVRKRLAVLLSLAFALAALVGLPTTSLIGAPAAHASVAPGDLVYMSYDPSGVGLSQYDGSTSTHLYSENPYGTNLYPDVSPDGSRAVFTDAHAELDSTGATQYPFVVQVMNSDGSGVIQITGSDYASGGYNDYGGLLQSGAWKRWFKQHPHYLQCRIGR